MPHVLRGVTEPRRLDPNDLHVDVDVEVEQLFAVVPEWLLRAELPPMAKVLYAVIQRFGNNSGHRMPGQAELARWLGCHPATVHRATCALEAYGALRVERSPAVRKGDGGVVRQPNRYFLRTTDPKLTHVIPASRGTRKTAIPPSRRSAATVPAPLLDDPGGNNPSPPTPSRSPNARPRSLKAAVAEIPVDDLASLGDLDELCARLGVLRREHGLPPTPWSPVNVGRAITDAWSKGYPPRKMPDALAALAVDPETRSPKRLGNDGPWWDIRDLDTYAEQRRAAEAERAATARAEAAAAAAAIARAAAVCTNCHGTGRTTRTVNVLGQQREVSVACTHGQEATG
jgi:cytochrome c553